MTEFVFQAFLPFSSSRLKNIVQRVKTLIKICEKFDSSIPFTRHALNKTIKRRGSRCLFSFSCIQTAIITASDRKRRTYSQHSRGFLTLITNSGLRCHITRNMDTTRVHFSLFILLKTYTENNIKHKDHPLRDLQLVPRSKPYIYYVMFTWVIVVLYSNSRNTVQCDTRDRDGAHSCSGADWLLQSDPGDFI